MRWLDRYLTESSPALQHFVQLATDLVRLERRWRTREPRFSRARTTEELSYEVSSRGLRT